MYGILLTTLLFIALHTQALDQLGAHFPRKHHVAERREPKVNCKLSGQMQNQTKCKVALFQTINPIQEKRRKIAEITFGEVNETKVVETLTGLALSIDAKQPEIQLRIPQVSCLSAGTYWCDVLQIRNSPAALDQSRAAGQALCQTADAANSKLNDSIFEWRSQATQIEVEPGLISLMSHVEAQEIQTMIINCSVHTTLQVQWVWESQQEDEKWTQSVQNVTSGKSANDDNACWLHYSVLTMVITTSTHIVRCYVIAGNHSYLEHAASVAIPIGIAIKNDKLSKEEPDRSIFLTNGGIGLILIGSTAIALFVIVLLLINLQRQGAFNWFSSSGQQNNRDSEGGQWNVAATGDTHDKDPKAGHDKFGVSSQVAGNTPSSPKKRKQNPPKAFKSNLKMAITPKRMLTDRVKEKTAKDAVITMSDESGAGDRKLRVHQQHSGQSSAELSQEPSEQTVGMLNQDKLTQSKDSLEYLEKVIRQISTEAELATARILRKKTAIAEQKKLESSVIKKAGGSILCSASSKTQPTVCLQLTSPGSLQSPGLNLTTRKQQSISPSCPLPKSSLRSVRSSNYTFPRKSSSSIPSKRNLPPIKSIERPPVKQHLRFDSFDGGAIATATVSFNERNLQRLSGMRVAKNSDQDDNRCWPRRDRKRSETDLPDLNAHNTAQSSESAHLINSLEVHRLLSNDSIIPTNSNAERRTAPNVAPTMLIRKQSRSRIPYRKTYAGPLCKSAQREHAQTGFLYSENMKTFAPSVSTHTAEMAYPEKANTLTSRPTNQHTQLVVKSAGDLRGLRKGKMEDESDLLRRNWCVSQPHDSSDNVGEQANLHFAPSGSSPGTRTDSDWSLSLSLSSPNSSQNSGMSRGSLRDKLVPSKLPTDSTLAADVSPGKSNHSSSRLPVLKIRTNPTFFPTLSHEQITHEAIKKAEEEQASFEQGTLAADVSPGKSNHSGSHLPVLKIRTNPTFFPTLSHEQITHTAIKKAEEEQASFERLERQVNLEESLATIMNVVDTAGDPSSGIVESISQKNLPKVTAQTNPSDARTSGGSDGESNLSMSPKENVMYQKIQTQPESLNEEKDQPECRDLVSQEELTIQIQEAPFLWKQPSILVEHDHYWVSSVSSETMSTATTTTGMDAKACSDVTSSA